MRLKVVEVASKNVGLPPELVISLGGPAELEAEIKGEALILQIPVRPPGGRPEPGTPAALDACLDTLQALPPDIGFSPEEVSRFRAEARAADLAAASPQLAIACFTSIASWPWMPWSGRSDTAR